MPPDPPRLLAPSALDSILAGSTLNCVRWAWIADIFSENELSLSEIVIL